MSDVHSAAQIGQRVRQTRKQLGLTQPQLALAVGVSIRFIVDLKAGKSTVRLDRVLQVLAGLGLTLQISDSSNSVVQTSNKSDWAGRMPENLPDSLA